MQNGNEGEAGQKTRFYGDFEGIGSGGWKQGPDGVIRELRFAPGLG